MENIPSYPKGDLRRMLSVLAAIDTLRRPTLVHIAELTGIDKKTVTSLIEKARVEASVSIEKTDAVYSISDWGPIIRKTGAKMTLTGALNAPKIK